MSEDTREQNLNDDYKNIVQSAESTTNEEVTEDVIKQGRVNMDRFKQDEARPADFHLGYHDVPVVSLPSSGMFYPDDTQVSIRAAKVAEVRHFSAIDEQNILDVDEKLNAIVESCIRITSKNTRLSYKDLCEEDRFYILLSIRDLTFPEPETNLTVDHRDTKGMKHTIDIDKRYFQYFEIPAELDKYYSREQKTFLIETKSFGTLAMRPPSIGVMQQMTGYIKERQSEGLEIDQSVLQIMPYIVSEWRGFNKKKIFEFEMEMNGWSTSKYSLIYKLAEKMKIGVQPNMLVALDGGEDVEIPINFRDGIKSLFIIQDFAGELL
jgi:hypothetical protein|tara:strand:+ start:1914 stop:2879 length:966 start_codon:yes stop_codon:yes gene_type:complete